MKVREISGLDDVRGVVRLYRQVWKNSFGIVDLLAALQARYPALKLVARSSHRLLRFYRDLGFQEEGRFENYYAAGRDGVRLAWRRRTAGSGMARGAGMAGSAGKAGTRSKKSLQKK